MLKRACDNCLGWMGRALARYLSAPVRRYLPVSTVPPRVLRESLRPGDVLLVEGNTRLSTAIKYLTQSTWSHAALYVGPLPGAAAGDPDPPVLVEADIQHGVWAVPLSRYENSHTRICRPKGLTPQDVQRVATYALRRIGHRYDLKNVIDLARYLLPTPPVPLRWRRRMLALGSGEPTRAICSTLIAQAFQTIRYPVLPEIERRPARVPGCDDCYDEILHIRHHSLFAPRDFDISPYFEIVKPGLDDAFCYTHLHWEEDGGRADPANAAASPTPVAARLSDAG
ncbi:MAG: YiiX/YebB-like N1pC/P60 family cysteine hydrolase [Pseudomonadota bacterium]